MNHRIIGSRFFVTLFLNNPRIQSRVKPDTDFDVLVEHEPSKEDLKFFKEKYGSKTELHCCPPLWSWMENWIGSYDGNDAGKKSFRNIYFTLKASHVFFHKVHFQKTIYDLNLMSEEGCKIIEPLFYQLYDHWKEKFTEPWRADFDLESSEFFADAVSRENLHDELHKAVIDPELGQPAFKFLQEPNQTTVFVCPKKFDEVSEYIRRRVVIEEAQALALERDILPNRINNKNISYQRWLKALVQRLCPLWMTIYIINNLNFFLTYKEDYAETYLSRN